jgi:starch phosphorylase
MTASMSEARGEGRGNEPRRAEVDALKAAFREHLFHELARFPEVATQNDRYLALALAVRDRMLDRWVRSGEAFYRNRVRTVVYLSAEYLIGPQLESNLLSLGLLDEAKTAMTELGIDWRALVNQEEEPGLGNGGLGRLAACFLDSMATLQIPSIGYGIRYEFGIFDQRIVGGEQVEITDKWLRLGNPWEIARPEVAFEVGFGGHTEWWTDAAGRERVRWRPERVVRGTAYDTPILGFGVGNANLLRLFKAEAVDAFDFQAFNAGDYWRAVESKVASETISKVLYPNDAALAGRRLRLEQQLFFASCALQDMIRLHRQSSHGLGSFADRYAAQLNDTHPAIAVAELMRLLIDEHGIGWDEAWETTRSVFAYTNHTLLPEALEKWSVELFGAVAPRHLEIVYEINRRFLDGVRIRFPDDDLRLRRLSIIGEEGGRAVRMAHLATVGSHSVNGVAALHSQLLARHVLADFHQLWPDKIKNVTNGVTPRRFLLQINPGLAKLLTEAIGDGWVRDLEQLRRIESLAEDTGFRAAWRAVKLEAKRKLAARIERRVGIRVDPESLLDIQVKRIHEYKRQHLNVLHVLALHRRLRGGGGAAAPPRTVVFAGKAAPGYKMAKRMIRLIHAVAEWVNGDPAMSGRLRVVFLPDFNVKNAAPIYPAADLSEQISTAGMEASGTGNMKFALNGALTIGTMDGANVEIREEVGDDNIFIFGLTAPEVAALRPTYDPGERYRADPELARVLDMIRDGAFSPSDPGLFQPIVDALLHWGDHFLLLADYASYIAGQDRVARAYGNPAAWTRMSILNVAKMGKFSSDRTIREYAQEIWRVTPVRI